MLLCKMKILWGMVIITGVCYSMDLKKYALTEIERQSLLQFDMERTEQDTYTVNGNFIASFELYKKDGQSIFKLSLEPAYFQTLSQQSPKIQNIVRELYELKILEILNTNRENKRYCEVLIWNSFWYRFGLFAPHADQFEFLGSDDFEFSSLGVSKKQST